MKYFIHRKATILIGMLCWFIIGCDESTRQTVISGLESGTQTIVASLLSAAFQSINS